MLSTTCEQYIWNSCTKTSHSGSIFINTFRLKIEGHVLLSVVAVILLLRFWSEKNSRIRNILNVLFSMIICKKFIYLKTIKIVRKKIKSERTFLGKWSMFMTLKNSEYQSVTSHEIQYTTICKNRWVLQHLWIFWWTCCYTNMCSLFVVLVTSSE